MIAIPTHVKMEAFVKMESRLSPVHVKLALLEHDVKQVSVFLRDLVLVCVDVCYTNVVCM